MEIYYNENFDVYIMYLVGALMIIVGIVFIDIEAKNITSRKDISKDSKIRLAIFKFLIIVGDVIDRIAINDYNKNLPQLDKTSYTITTSDEWLFHFITFMTGGLLGGFFSFQQDNEKGLNLGIGTCCFGLVASIVDIAVFNA